MQREENCKTEQERHKEVNFRSLYIKNTNLPPPKESCNNYLKNISSLETQHYQVSGTSAREIENNVCIIFRK